MVNWTTNQEDIVTVEEEEITPTAPTGAFSEEELWKLAQAKKIAWWEEELAQAITERWQRAEFKARAWAVEEEPIIERPQVWDPELRWAAWLWEAEIIDETLLWEAADAWVATEWKTATQIKAELLKQKWEAEKLKEAAEVEKERLAWEAAATKFTRDVELARAKTEAEALRIKEDLNRQFDEQIRKSGISKDKMANNLNLLRGQLWAATSKNAVNAINSRNNEAVLAISNLKSSKQRQLNLVWDELQSEIERFDRLLDDTVSKAFQDTIDLFSAADLQWKLDDIKWLQEVNLQAVTILDRLDEEIWTQLDNVDFVIAATKEQADIEKEFLKNAWEINKDISFASWFLTDNNWNQLLKDWKPIAIDPTAWDKVWEFTNEVEWTKTLVFRNPATWKLTEKSFDIWVEPTAAPKPIVVGKDSFLFDNVTKSFITNPFSTNNSATVWNSQLVITSWTSNNRPDRNNNPFNVKSSPINAWISTSTDDENHLIFNTAEEWLQAGINDVTAKMEKRTTNPQIIASMEKRLGKKFNEITQQEWIDNITIWDLWSWFAEDPKWANWVAANLWTNKDTKIATLNKNQLFKAIARQEWYTGNLEILDKAINPDVEQWAITVMKDPAKITTVPADLKTEVNTRANELRKERWGNDKFQKLKTEDIDKLAKFIELGKNLKKIEDLKKSVDTWPVAKKLAQGIELTWIWTKAQLAANKKFIEIDLITGKVLAEFIKSISGAAVSVDEARRLWELIPWVWQSDARFDIALTNMKTEFNSILSTKIKQFWFDNKDALNSAVFWTEIRESFSNKNSLTSNSSDEDIEKAYENKVVTKDDLNDKSSDEDLMNDFNW